MQENTPIKRPLPTPKIPKGKEPSRKNEAWKFLKYSLIETKQTGENLSEKASKMIKIIEEAQLISSNLDSTKNALLTKAIYHHQILAANKPFSDITLTQETNPEPTVITNIFDNLNTKISEDKNGSFLLYTISCACLTRNQPKLSAILNKIYAPNDEEKSKNCEFIANIENYLIFPTQQLPRLDLFADSWLKKLFEEKIVLNSVENLKAIFKNIASANDWIRDMVITEQTQKEEQDANSLFPSFSFSFSFLKTEENAETVLNDQAISEKIQQALSKNKLISLKDAQSKEEKERRQSIIIPNNPIVPEKPLDAFQKELKEKLEKKNFFPTDQTAIPQHKTPISTAFSTPTPEKPNRRPLPIPKTFSQIPQQTPSSVNFNITINNGSTIINNTTIINVYASSPQNPLLYPGTIFLQETSINSKTSYKTPVNPSPGDLKTTAKNPHQ